MYTEEDALALAELLADPLRWAEAVLKNPETGGPFEANHVERLILSCKHPRVAIRVHRRAGKSYSLAILALWAAMVHKFYDILIIAPSDDQVSELFELINSFVNSTPVVLDSVQEKTKNPHFIKFRNGSTIKGKTTGASSRREAMTLRGKGAHLVIIDEGAYLAEQDFKAITPIILGDQYKRKTGEEVRAYIASTPSDKQGRYYDWCMDDSGEWHQIHVPITENPDYSESDIDLIRSVTTEVEWITEYLAEFLDSGFGAFKNSDIVAAKSNYRYSPSPIKKSGSIRAAGVDWDKYQAGVNICVVEWIPGQTKYTLLYREEVPRTQYTLSYAVERIIAMNEVFELDHIYVDRGYGEHAVEALKLYGKKNPSSGLHEKVKGFSFNQNVTIIDPIDNSKISKQFKAVMINNLFRLFEERKIEFSCHDKQLEKQLSSYKIIGVGSNTIKTTRRNEHIIDALGLACYAISSNYDSQIDKKSSATSYRFAAPKVIPGRLSRDLSDKVFSGIRSAITEPNIVRSMSRKNLSSRGVSSRKF